jgi:hypothetical protein
MVPRGRKHQSKHSNFFCRRMRDPEPVLDETVIQNDALCMTQVPLRVWEISDIQSFAIQTKACRGRQTSQGLLRELNAATYAFYVANTLLPKILMWLQRVTSNDKVVSSILASSILFAGVYPSFIFARIGDGTGIGKACTPLNVLWACFVALCGGK